MPRVRFTQPSEDALKLRAREFSILKSLSGGEDGVEGEVLLKAAPIYAGDVEAVSSLVSAADSELIDFELFAAAFAKGGQAAGSEGEGNCLGYAARDTSGALSPLVFKRRELGPKDLVIKITHAGMCHSDLHTIRGEWGPPSYPIVPGHEIVGIVTQAGPEVTRFAVGDRAGAAVFVDSCRECVFCKARKEEQFCPKIVWTYNSTHYDGLPAQGGYSDNIVMDEAYTYTLPANLPLERIAPLLCAGITTFSPYVDNGLDKPGLRIGVVGLGGLGHMAVKFGVAFGCEVVVISRNRAKEAEALALGATSVLPSSDEEALKAAEGTLDGIIDTVSAQHDVSALLNLLSPRGKLILVGLPPGQLSINHFKLVIGNLSLGGSVIGSVAQTQRMLDFCAEHSIGADVEVIDIQDTAAAFERMEKGDVKFRFVIDVAKSLIA